MKRTCAISGAETSARAVPASPWTTCSSPSGSPARTKTRAIRSAASAASGDGCRTTPLPPIKRDRDVAERGREGFRARGQDGDDAERLERQARALDRLQRARQRDALGREDPRTAPRQPLQRLDGRQQLHALDLGQRPALLGDEHAHELVPLVDDRLRGARQVERSIAEPQLRPQLLDLGRLGDGGPDRIRLGHPHRAQRRAVDRADGGDPGGGGGHPVSLGSVDERGALT